MLLDTAEDLGAIVRAERTRRGWTQAALARTAGVGRQWLVALEAGHHRAELGMATRVLAALDLHPSVTPGEAASSAGAPALALAMREALRGGDEVFALRLLAHDVGVFRQLPPDGASRWLAEPSSTGDHRWDVLLGAVFARECRRRGVDAPPWTAAPPLAAWWFPLWNPVLAARTMQHTPVDLACRGIWLDERALETR